MNTLTDLIPSIYEALDVVSREQVGYQMAVSRDNSVARAAVGQDVISPVSAAQTATNITPGVTAPDDGDFAVDNVKLNLTHARRVPVRITGEETVGLDHGPGSNRILVDQFAQGFRTLANEMESSIAANYIYASRAYGAAGQTPFNDTDGIRASAQALKILIDNGAPKSMLKMVIDTAAGAELRSLKQLVKVNEAGMEATLRTGSLGPLTGFEFYETGAYQEIMHTPGTGAGYLVNSAALAVGDTDIPIDTGAGTILPGDVVTFNGDPNKYVVEASAAGMVTIAKPGLRSAVADDSAMTIAAAYTANLAFSQSAIHLATRVPALPTDGDMARDRQIVTDPFSGMSFEVAQYAQYRQMQYEISAVWGSKVVKKEHVALVLG